MADGFTCSHCGESHGAAPLSYHAEAPAFWTPELAERPDCELASDQCVIDGDMFFVRGLVEIPVIDTGDTFAWGVWVSLSRNSFLHISERWHSPGREQDDPYFGWFSSELNYTPATINLKVNLHSRPVGFRPLVDLEPTDHPLAVEQREGISSARVRQIAEELLHA